jgi:hypothetical protein
MGNSENPTAPPGKRDRMSLAHYSQAAGRDLPRPYGFPRKR